MGHRVAATVAVVSLFASQAALAQDRCKAAQQPSDRLSTETCDTCPHADPDESFRLLDRAADAGRIPQVNRKLGALAEKSVKDALSKGLDVGNHWDLSQYGLVGVDTGLGVILDRDQTPAQKEAAAQGAVWMRHSVGAQASVNLGATIPVGPDGFYVRTGTSAGANVKVTVDKQYDKRLASLAENAALNQLTVPYAAVDAASMKPGERVTIVGNGNVAVSGGAGYGVNVDNVVPNVSVGATVAANATRVLSGNFSTEVTKESGNNVRVTLRTAEATDTSADARLFAGAAVNRDGLEIGLQSGINVVDAAMRKGVEAAAKGAEKVLSAEFVTRHGDLSSNGELQEYTFDLSRRESRRAYEDALLGDFRAAAELAGCDAGVGFVKDVNDKVDTAYKNTKLAVSLLTYTTNATSTDDHRTIRDAAGTRAFDLFNFHYDSRAFSGSGSRVDVGTVAGVSGAIGADGKSVSLSYRGEAENRFFTSSGEMKDLVFMGKSMAQGDLRADAEMSKIMDSGRAGLVLPSFINYYGRTKMGLDLTISKSGIDRIAQTSDEDMWAAFAATRRDAPLWATPEGRARMEDYERFGKSDNNNHDSARWNEERWYASSYEHDRDAIAKLSQLKNAGSDSDRAKLLRDAAESMGDDFTA
ncbi:MAG TPA: hypothetical protein VMV18_09830, partial [bacterium]|nr:hypothetical protein [bacterium]